MRRRLAAAALGLASLLGGVAVAHAEPGGKTIDLVISEWHFALYETPARTECPDGFQYKSVQNYMAEFPTPEARQARETRYGYDTNQGPHGENTYYFPEAIQDPLPFRDAKGPIAIGMNLDGDLDGKGTATTLPHEKFTSPGGERGIDNQLYRVLGCVTGWRKGGIIEGNLSQYLRSDAKARILLEITGVTDEQNSPDVTITTYRGRDPVYADSTNTLIPWLSQRVDEASGRRYVNTIKGRIVDGVLISDPIDVRLPAYERTTMFTDRNIKQMRMRLKLTPTGAEGLIGGYLDIEDWYYDYVRNWGGYALGDVSGWSGPATYQALKRFADYHEPGSQTATAISTDYQVVFTRTYIVHSPQRPAVTAQGPQAQKASFQ